MRIITGQYKGRHFDIPRTFKARPTTDFAKENIFNVLNGYLDFEGATALDLFAGTGSISLELVSRGCERVISVEMDRNHANFIRQCMTKIGTDKNVLIKGDVFRFLKSCKQQFDFIFADPPYALKELATIPDLIFRENEGKATGRRPMVGNAGERGNEDTLLKPDGVFVLEHGKDYDFSQHPHFVEHRSYGSVNFSLFR
ncbi:MAG: RsmD family RNA methyltransferase [Prevotella sp.]|nr:RsmD family RNA methyltransferase [Prevotella sp.]